eukprot:scaffold196757_cov26-Prasinocladus_malaysianus.AAC.2
MQFVGKLPTVCYNSQLLPAVSSAGPPNVPRSSAGHRDPWVASLALRPPGECSPVNQGTEVLKELIYIILSRIEPPLLIVGF